MASVALLVVDQQAGAFDGKLIPPIYEGERLIDLTKQLIAAARRANMNVIYIQHCAAEGVLIKDTEAWQIHPSLAPTKTDQIIEKRASNAFEGTTLAQKLTAKDIQALIVCGLQSEHCVFNTAMDAIKRELTVYVAADAHSTWSTKKYSAVEIIDQRNQNLAEHGASVLPVSELISQVMV